MARIPLSESRASTGQLRSIRFHIVHFFFVFFFTTSSLSQNVKFILCIYFGYLFPQNARNRKRFLRYLSAHFLSFYSRNFQHFVVYLPYLPIRLSIIPNMTTANSNRSAPRWARSFASPCAAKDPDSGQHWGAVVSGARHQVTLMFRPTTTFHLFTGFVYELLLL